MTEATCNLCGGRDFSVVCKPQAKMRIPLSIVKCSHCCLLYAHPIPTEIELEKIYSQSYFHCASPIEGGYENYVQDELVIKKTFAGRLRIFLPFISKAATPAVLDIGCATGVFLDVMRERGWQTFGLEISDFAATIAQKKGFSVTREKLEKSKLPSESFDLITMWDVIEHVADPLRTLQTCNRLLKPKGCLVLTTPDASSLLARITGNYWMGFRPVGEHVYFFGRETLKQYLEKCGFEVVQSTAVGKHLPFERLLTRLIYYTRVFRILSPLQTFFRARISLYVNSGDTMCLVARKI